MNPAVNLRFASHEDASAVYDLVRQLAVYEKLEHEVTSSVADIERMLRDANSKVEVLLAETGEQAVGFALFFENFSTFRGKPGLYLEDLFVMPAWRRRGIGLALLDRLLRLARDRGYGRVDWAVLDWNEPAIRFYTEKLGAAVLNEWRLCRITL